MTRSTPDALGLRYEGSPDSKHRCRDRPKVCEPNEEGKARVYPFGFGSLLGRLEKTKCPGGDENTATQHNGGDFCSPRHRGDHAGGVQRKGGKQECFTARP